MSCNLLEPCFDGKEVLLFQIFEDLTFEPIYFLTVFPYVSFHCARLKFLIFLEKMKNIWVDFFLSILRKFISLSMSNSFFLISINVRPNCDFNCPVNLMRGNYRHTMPRLKFIHERFLRLIFVGIFMERSL
jgi:hypothetical protein